MSERATNWALETCGFFTVVDDKITVGRTALNQLLEDYERLEQKNEQQVANCRNDRIARETAEERIRSLQNALVVAHARLARNGPTDVG